LDKRKHLHRPTLRHHTPPAPRPETLRVKQSLGNVLVTIGDRRIPRDGTIVDNTAEFYDATVLSANDYYQFGMELPGRTFAVSSGYRYGFNGKEKDPSEFGSLTHYDYGFRIYNPAIGKFLSVDPLKKEYPWYTPYQFAVNMPILCYDVDGKEGAIGALWGQLERLGANDPKYKLGFRKN
jgi:RHS repeat-associated protein